MLLSLPSEMISHVDTLSFTFKQLRCPYQPSAVFTIEEHPSHEFHLEQSIQKLEHTTQVWIVCDRGPVSVDARIL